LRVRVQEPEVSSFPADFSGFFGFGSVNFGVVFDKFAIDEAELF
jgi:hypothetical protein